MSASFEIGGYPWGSYVPGAAIVSLILVVGMCSQAGDEPKVTPESGNSIIANTDVPLSDRMIPASPRPEEVRPAAEGKLGQEIPAWSDPRASYTDEGSGILSNGNLWIVTRRSGPSGVTYSKREIDCASGNFRYLQEGESLEDMSDSVDEMGVLTEGSISTLVSDYACRKHRRGAVRGI